MFRKHVFLLYIVLHATITCAGISGFSCKDTSQTCNYRKLKIIYLGSGITYGGLLYTLNEYWYKDYARSGFHFFNDNKGWQQIDKVGHAFSAYYLGYLGISVFQSTGISDKKAIWIGGMYGSVFLTTIELLDGFSRNWGASVGDVATNTLGSFMVIAQELKWKDQKIKLKFSSHFVDYPAEVNDRAIDLYGTEFFEKVIKDYNGQTYWISLNPFSFFNHTNKFPKWLNIAIGYGTEGMLGATDNTWVDDNNIIVTSNMERYRQYYLSFDIDLTKVPIKSGFLSTVFKTINFIKIPAPAAEYNTLNKFVFHPLFF